MCPFTATLKTEGSIVHLLLILVWAQLEKRASVRAVVEILGVNSNAHQLFAHDSFVDFAHSLFYFQEFMILRIE